MFGKITSKKFRKKIDAERQRFNWHRETICKLLGRGSDTHSLEGKGNTKGNTKKKKESERSRQHFSLGGSDTGKGGRWRLKKDGGEGTEKGSRDW